MSWYTNNGNSGAPYGSEDNRERSGHYALMPQQHAPVFGNSSRSGPYGAESYMATGFAPTMGSWSNNAFPGHSVPAHRESAWSGGSHLDETNLGSWFGPLGSSGSQSDLDQLLGMNIGSPLSEPSFPAAPHTPQHFSAPPPSWPQAPGQHWQSAPSAHAVRHRGDHGNPAGPFGQRPDVPPFRTAAPSSTIGHPERQSMQAGYSHLSASPSSAQFPTRGGPAPVSPSPPFQSRGERWDPPNTVTFRCEWTTTSRGTGTRRCAARIAGDRRSVTSHLRDEHGFTCDGETIACAWAGCMTESMQRRNIPRHIVACHMGIKVPCPGCGMLLSRADAKEKHRQACMGARVRSPGCEDDEGSY